MRIAYPVIFCLNGVEHAATVIKSSPRDPQTVDPNLNLTQRARLNELRVDVAYFDPEIRGWRVHEDVPYLSQEQLIPESPSAVYYETGAPDPQERAANQQRYTQARGITEGAPIAGAQHDRAIVDELEDERPSTSADLALEESIDEGLEQEATQRAEQRMDAESPALETKPIG